MLRVDHPDIEEFITAKNNSDKLTQFNITVGVTDEFMQAVKEDKDFDLKFEGRVYKTVSATALQDRSYVVPGTRQSLVSFSLIINKKNNLQYCEKIAATNPVVGNHFLLMVHVF